MRKPWNLMLTLGLIASLGVTASAQSPQLDSCDATWLWPVPTNAAEADRLIDMDELKAEDGSAVLSDQSFADLLAAVDSGAASVSTGSNQSSKIELSSALRERGNWKIAGMRIDATAPGGHGDIRAVYGELPQIRLILQPVTVNGMNCKVHDFAMHVVYSFPKPNTRPSEPDEPKFREILDDFLALKKKCEDAGVMTTGAKLGIHPGLKNNAIDGLTDDVQAMLKKYLHDHRLSALAIMGLDPPEPWIFMSLFRPQGPGTNFVVFPIPVFNDPSATDDADKRKTAQMLTFRATPHILPVAQTDNLSPIAHNPNLGNLFQVPLHERKGVSMSEFFSNNFAADLDAPAKAGVAADGSPILDAQMKNKDIPDYIANPTKCHFFNTDCLSCHVESQRREKFNLAPSSFAFEWPAGIAELDPGVKQTTQWNVRNLGWFPRGGSVAPTISQRTANETAEAVSYINEKYLAD
ncbi:hypothetical protein Pan97_20780 [Bremerella volcania]|uniref:Cytochrome c domain-containing protein n=1 Tax=Bremerella volcania TaxID=2527984 RepID=A0A518C751_9BACT|nr:hypothetical protein [Bremerella volcania]QDU75057.1 hypothetical protein Pan97_20780 [Bremerella volcania]